MLMGGGSYAVALQGVALTKLINNPVCKCLEIRSAQITRIEDSIYLIREVAEGCPPCLAFAHGVSTTAAVPADFPVQQDNELVLPTRHGHGDATTII